MNLRSYMTQGVATFKRAQIYDQADSGVCELMRVDKDYIPLELGKSASKIIDKVHIPEDQTPWQQREVRCGNYFYLWSKPLTNYYHCVLDGLGCLHHYLNLKKRHSDLTLLINRTPRMGLDDYPPFVAEMLDLLNIPWQYTDSTVDYECLYVGDTLNQDANGKRTQVNPLQWQLIDTLVKRAKQSVTMPVYEKVYLSRRAHANPLNNRKQVIGEDNTVKRGLVNEDSVVDILTDQGYTEVFGENYTLAEKIVLFSQMNKYISAAGAGVTNMLWVRDHPVSVGGIHTPGFGFPGPNHERHICANRPYCKATINLYKGMVKFEDPQPTKGYNHPWRIENLTEFRAWSRTI